MCNGCDAVVNVANRVGRGEGGQRVGKVGLKAFPVNFGEESTVRGSVGTRNTGLEGVSKGEDEGQVVTTEIVDHIKVGEDG